MGREREKINKLMRINNKSNIRVITWMYFTGFLIVDNLNKVLTFFSLTKIKYIAWHMASRYKI